MLTSDMAAIANWMEPKLHGNPISTPAAAIGCIIGGIMVAGACFNYYTGRSIVGSIAATKLTKEFMYAIFDYPFNQLGVEKIIAYVEESNPKSIRLLEHMGFKKEASVSAVYDSGAMLIYSMIREDCKWLES